MTKKGIKLEGHHKGGYEKRVDLGILVNKKQGTTYENIYKT